MSDFDFDVGGEPDPNDPEEWLMVDPESTPLDLASGIGQLRGTNEDPTRLIDWFDGSRFDFLSNFHPVAFLAPGPIPGPVLSYPTGEHYFQAWKATTIGGFEAIRLAESPHQAKLRGRRIQLRPDWEEVKIGVMRDCLSYKFAPGSELAERLLATGDAFLMEGNTWHDRVWGVYDGEGENWLGWLLMAQRAALRSGLLT